MSKIWIITVIVVVATIGAYFLFMNNKAKDTETSKTTTGTNTVVTKYANITERTISLTEQNGSGESGSVVLIEKDGKVTVTLDMTGTPLDVPQPAHIHSGSCPDVGAVAYPLTNVVNGKSETVLDTTFAKLDAKLPLAINVHKSAAESKVYVSCGNLGATATSPAPTSSPSPSPTASPVASPTPSTSPTASPM